MICMTVAASLTLVAKQVRQSREAQAGTTPVVLTLPTVAFNPTHPLKPAGIRPALACNPSLSKGSFVVIGQLADKSLQWPLDKRSLAFIQLHS